MFATIIKLIPGWLKAAVGALVAVLLAFGAGQWAGLSKGRTEAENDALKRDAKAVTRRDETRREIEGETDEGLVDRITNRPK